MTRFAHHRTLIKHGRDLTGASIAHSANEGSRPRGRRMLH